MNTILIIIIVAVVVIGLIIMDMYNGLIRKKNEVENAFGGMDVQLKKRYDLIPNLISTVKQYMTHEKELLTKVTELRSHAMNGKVSNEQKVDLDNQITGAMKGIMVAVESYPDLKANENFMNLQKTMNEVESQISAARRAYNASITDFNNGVQMFPSSIVAGMMKLSVKKVFQIPEIQGNNVKVNDLFK
ncbi:MAG: LemA family protein [Bacteroidales bacterium]|nr:LemA family protein [Bacteroidales bacterium]